MNEKTYKFQFNEPSPSRLDKFLTRRMSNFSRSRLQSLIKAGQVKVNGEVIQKTGSKLDHATAVEITVPAPVSTEMIPENIPLDVVFEDSRVLVVNKPAGMVVHPSPGHNSGTLVHAALAHIPDLEGVGGEKRPGIVHRLDKNTSGLIILAKNDATLQKLQSQFSSRKVHKTYIALVDGHPPTPEGRVEASIGRDPSHRQRMAVVSAHKGRDAITEYLTSKTYRKHALLQVHPTTGRTHQIRVHLSFLECPVAGDTIYGNANATIQLKRHFLHAAKLTLVIGDDEKTTTFEAPLPEELEQVLEKLH